MSDRSRVGFVLSFLQTVASRKKCESRKRGLEMKGRVGEMGGAEGMAGERMERPLQLRMAGRAAAQSDCQCFLLLTVRCFGGAKFSVGRFLAQKKRPKVRSLFAFSLCTCTDCDGFAPNEGL